MKRVKPREAPLWKCPACDRRFANRNQTHFCGKHRLETHFESKSPEARQLFDALVRLLESFGPVTINAEKSRIAFQVRMSFAAVSVRKAQPDRASGTRSACSASAIQPNRHDLGAKPRPSFSAGIAERAGRRVCGIRSRGVRRRRAETPRAESGQSSNLITSPPARVSSAYHRIRSWRAGRRRTDPSHKSAVGPSACGEPL